MTSERAAAACTPFLTTEALAVASGLTKLPGKFKGARARGQGPVFRIKPNPFSPVIKKPKYPAQTGR